MVEAVLFSMCDERETDHCLPFENLQVVETKKQSPERTAVLTPPLSLEWQQQQAEEHGFSNLVLRVLSLFRGIRAGSDITRLQLPPQFNMPKSQLQCYGEIVCCTKRDLLSECARGETSLERISAVAAWSVSTVRPFFVDASPFNPILGETHHVSRGSLNVLLEQVSHHPPVSALHATDSKAKLELVWCQNPSARFTGTGVEAPMRGFRRLKLLSHGETYELETPAMVVKFLPVPSTGWAGVGRIKCKESDLEAELLYHRKNSVLGLGGNSRAVKGKIFNAETKETLREIYGHWDSEIFMKDVASGKISLFYDAKTTISKLETPILREPEALLDTESAVVWAEVSAAVLRRDWKSGREAKSTVEEEQRRRRREFEESGDIWEPKFFKLTTSKDDSWECYPNSSEVPPAPIVVSYGE